MEKILPAADSDPQDRPGARARRSAFIRDVIIGMSDGITVPFALTAGISGVVTGNTMIIIAGISEICAGSISMGLGGFLSAKTEIQQYYASRAKEYKEVHEVRESEKQEVRDALAYYGLSPKAQDLVADELSADEDQWVRFMMRNELGLEEPDGHRAAKSAFNIGLSYVVGGVIPLTGYVLTATPSRGLSMSSAITFVSLLVFGYLKSKFTGEPPLRGAIKTAAIGVIAASAAFGIAWFFNNRI
jgi:VIT1/CCC1 family predicted Fe2+/Mn2+ transporter